VLFQLGPITLRWYGLLIALAVLIGLNLSSWLAKQRNLESGLISDLLPILVLAAIIGARLYYVAFEWRSYQNSWWDVFAIWQGGIAIHGALIGGTISVILFCRWRKVCFWDLLDVLVPSVILGQTIGRWGNFFNSEAFGVPTQLPWKLFIPYSSRPPIFADSEFFSSHIPLRIDLESGDFYFSDDVISMGEERTDSTPIRRFELHVSALLQPWPCVDRGPAH
jgi:phosphatidylglycerol:prolipoprotein diacylglycerol transferase